MDKQLTALQNRVELLEMQLIAQKKESGRYSPEPATAGQDNADDEKPTALQQGDM